MNNGMYPIEDFGCEIDYSESAKGGVAKVTKTPVKEAADWLKLTPCPITEDVYKRQVTNHKQD